MTSEVPGLNLKSGANLSQRLASMTPTTRADRIKLIGAIAVIVVCGAWLTWQLVSMYGGGGATRAPDSPAWRIVNPLNERLYYS